MHEEKREARTVRRKEGDRVAGDNGKTETEVKTEEGKGKAN